MPLQVELIPIRPVPGEGEFLHHVFSLNLFTLIQPAKRPRHKLFIALLKGRSGAACGDATGQKHLRRLDSSGLLLSCFIASLGWRAADDPSAPAPLATNN